MLCLNLVIIQDILEIHIDFQILSWNSGPRSISPNEK